MLKKALDLGENVIIGLSTDKFVKKLDKIHEVTSYETRLLDLKKYFKTQGVTEQVRIIPLHDRYGITLSNKQIDAIVVSQETEQWAHKINRIREAKGIPTLSVITIKTVKAEDNASISTTRITRKEIDCRGNLLSS